MLAKGFKGNREISWAATTLGGKQRALAHDESVTERSDGEVGLGDRHGFSHLGEGLVLDQTSSNWFKQIVERPALLRSEALGPRDRSSIHDTISSTRRRERRLDIARRATGFNDTGRAHTELPLTEFGHMRIANGAAAATDHLAALEAVVSTAQHAKVLLADAAEVLLAHGHDLLREHDGFFLGSERLDVLENARDALLHVGLDGRVGGPGRQVAVLVKVARVRHAQLAGLLGRVVHEAHERHDVTCELGGLLESRQVRHIDRLHDAERDLLALIVFDHVDVLKDDEVAVLRKRAGTLEGRPLESDVAVRGQLRRLHDVLDHGAVQKVRGEHAHHLLIRLSRAGDHGLGHVLHPAGKLADGVHVAGHMLAVVGAEE